ncbi:NUDIX hydrolase [Robiginitalea sp.]|jgi:8-oxo-dGTP pyrophosphatase MutT (NUDIX family)|uniref:NUDIX hydrolase n=1 Tax=Robiginitalea sp. TaxID=1902411 RepID=UPI003C75CB53
MDFKSFSERISKIKNLPLPGESAHFEMAPEMRIAELKAMAKRPAQYRRAGVMALFYPGSDGVTRLLFILRNSDSGVHSAQVAFPGGQYENADQDLQQTALRETEEEVGVPASQIQLIRALSQVYIPPSRFEVSPFIGLLPHTPEFRKQDSEVADLIEVPVQDVMRNSNLVRRRLTTSYAREITVPAFELEGHIVWGATAMMLNEVKSLLKEILLT